MIGSATNFITMSQQLQPAPEALPICTAASEVQPAAAHEVEVSVVAPVYRNSDTLEELHERLSRVLSGITDRFEVIFVNDACPGGSLEVLEDLAREDWRVVVVSLERNVGQHRAVLEGLRRSRGRAVVVLDADLQDPPEAIDMLLERLSGEAAAVFAGRRGAYESAARLATSRIFKRLLHWLCGVPADAGMFVAMDRRMIEAVLTLGPSSPFVVAMIGCTGLPVDSIPVSRSTRPRGESAYSSFARIKSGCRAVVCVASCRWAATGRRTRRSKLAGVSN